MKNRKSQWEVGEIKPVVKDISKSVIPISMRDISIQYTDAEPNHNTDETNPFVENGGTIKETGDSQKLLQENFNDIGGYEPVMASKSDKYRRAIFDVQNPYDIKSPTDEGWGSPYAGPDDTTSMQPGKRRDFDPLTRKDMSQKMITRQENKEQIQPGMSDPGRELWDGNQI